MRRKTIARFSAARVTEVVGLHYQMAWPNREFTSGRDLRRTPLHDTLAAAGASFGQKLGWERPNWYAPSAPAPPTEYSFEKQNWFDWVGEEHRAAREGVALFEQSSFSKYRLRGAGALALLQRLCGNDLDVASRTGRLHGALQRKRHVRERLDGCARSGRRVLRHHGGDGQQRRDFDWIERHMPPAPGVSLVDVTTAFGVLGIMGPKAREVLQPVCDADLSHEAFPFGTAQRIGVGNVEALALRVTYVGELGWELHAPVEQLQGLYRALVEAGAPDGLRLAGHYAINSLRLEKGYRAWGHDISPDDSPLEAGLGFAVAWEKPGGFLGREALVRQRTEGVRRRLASFVLDDPKVMLWGSEPIRRDGEIAGYTTSAAYGYSVGGAIALGYVRSPSGEAVDAAFVREGDYTIEVGGRNVAARVSLRPPYDPKRERILC